MNEGYTGVSRVSERDRIGSEWGLGVRQGVREEGWVRWSERGREMSEAEVNEEWVSECEENFDAKVISL